MLLSIPFWSVTAPFIGGDFQRSWVVTMGSYLEDVLPVLALLRTDGRRRLVPRTSAVRPRIFSSVSL